jgi:glycosyltransferase involved in cell wall biosynthesis
MRGVERLSVKVATHVVLDSESLSLELNRHRLDPAGHEVALGFIGRITRDKGVAELLVAFEALSRKYPQAHLILVGPIEDSSILDSLDFDGSSKNVTFVGALDDVRNALWACDLFVLPSYREGFPVANLEAQACGVPVVTTTATGCRDSIAPQETGILVPPRDPQSLLLAMQDAIESQQTLAKWRLNCRPLVEANFDSRIVNERFVNYLESIVASS